jgi:hypothetical protein
VKGVPREEETVDEFGNVFGIITVLGIALGIWVFATLLYMWGPEFLKRTAYRLGRGVGATRKVGKKVEAITKDLKKSYDEGAHSPPGGTP